MGLSGNEILRLDTGRFPSAASHASHLYTDTGTDPSGMPGGGTMAARHRPQAETRSQSIKFISRWQALKLSSHDALASSQTRIMAEANTRMTRGGAGGFVIAIVCG
jgi:hypothetical protein